MSERVQVDIMGLSTSPTSSGAFALILKEVSGPRRLPIVIGQFEAQSIALEIEGVKPPRPLTHDLMKNIITTLGDGGLTEIFINDLRDGTFFARLLIDDKEIDSRPSDAIALAVRFGAPIYVAEKVMEEASFVSDPEEQEAEHPADEEAEPESDEEVFPKKETPKPQPPPRLNRLEMLEKQLSEAIAKEEYEKAARLRDEIKKMHS